MTRVRATATPEKTSEREWKFIETMTSRRKEYQLTQMELGEALLARGVAIDPNVIRLIEGGRRNIRLYEAYEIAEQFNFNLGDFQPKVPTVDELAIALAATARGWAAAEARKTSDK